MAQKHVCSQRRLLSNSAHQHIFRYGERKSPAVQGRKALTIPKRSDGMPDYNAVTEFAKLNSLNYGGTKNGKRKKSRYNHQC